MSEETPRDRAVQKWLDAVFALYPFETTGFMRVKRDAFANPVGHVTRQAAERLCDAVLGADIDQTDLRLVLADFVRVRAVQDFRPDQAVGAIFLLKPVLREIFLVDALAAGNLEDYLAMEDRVDSLVLMAFDLYVADREAIHAQRVAEQRRSTAQLTRWAARQGLSSSGEASEPGESSRQGGSRPEKASGAEAISRQGGSSGSEEAV